MNLASQSTAYARRIKDDDVPSNALPVGAARPDSSLTPLYRSKYGDGEQ